MFWVRDVGWWIAAEPLWRVTSNWCRVDADGDIGVPKWDVGFWILDVEWWIRTEQLWRMAGWKKG